MFARWIRQLISFFSLGKKEFNTLYFTLYSIVILAMTLSHFCLWQSPLFFFLQAIGQALLETGVLISIAIALNRWAPRWVFFTYISSTFTILLLHFVDFTTIRLLDVSIAYPMKFLFGNGILHLFIALQAMNVNAAMIGIVIGSILAIPLSGVLLYWVTSPLSKKIGWNLPLRPVLFSIGAIASALFALDLFFHPSMDQTAYRKYQKALPLGTTFITPEKQYYPLDGSLKQYRSEEAVQKTLQTLPVRAEKLPNIYLFVIETLRRDFTTIATAPHLTKFSAENLSFAESYSNASATQLSWFAIFHSDYPFHWTGIRDEWKEGSVPLQMLKQLGYKIRVYSSEDFHYFGVDELIFGKDRKLLDQLEDFTLNRNLAPCDRDALCFQSFYSDLEKSDAKQGNVFLFFLDSTHSEYSVPKDFPLKFAPIIEEIDYLTINVNQIEPLKNRYRNAISYIDSLMGEFFDRIKQNGLYDDAVIAITGDHGEEFFEEGSLFHGTHLNKYQTSVPLLYRFPNAPFIPQDTVSTHIDIFPTILHYLTGHSDFSDLFDGQSLFAPNRWPYRITVLQNGPDTPNEFAIEKSDWRIHCRFTDPESIYSSHSLEILSLQEKEPTPISNALFPLLQ